MIDPVGRPAPKRSLLIALRKRAKLSQQSLADYLGVRQATISDWETGKATPEMPPSIYVRLLHILKCTEEELVLAFEGEEALQGLPSETSSESSKTPL